MRRFPFMFVVLICMGPVKAMQQQLPEDLKAKVDELGERYTDLGRFSGKILVAHKGTVSYNGNFGFADYENEVPFSDSTVFYAGELTNLFNEAILLNMVAERRVNPDQKLSAHLPNVREEQTFEQHIKAIGKASGNEPTLEVVIEKLSNNSYQEELQILATRLGFENTHSEEKLTDEVAKGYLFHNYRGNGLELELASRDTLSPGVKTTARDLLKLLQYLPEREVKKEGFLPNGGFSFAVLENAMFEIIILSNRRHPVAGEMAAGIKSILGQVPYSLPLERKEFKIDPSLLDIYSGRYQINPERSIKISRSSDSLFLDMGPQKVHLKPQSFNQFFMEQQDSAIRFLKDPDGNVTSAELLDGFLNGKKIEKIP